MSNLLEILSPAGSMESLKAAINAGGDAMYIGGTSFGARASANNLGEDDMLRAIDYAHVHGKQLFLTVNTLVKEQELEEQLYDYLYQYYKHGIDALIVQDLGVLRFVHRHFPAVPKHASTQMTATMANGANELKKYGVNRLVTSRELSLQEIRAIRENTDLEIESFVHGALCYSFSGQCLMSSMIGGRSGNRGRCAQTCRMQYKVKDGDKVISQDEHSYILSPKDQCTIDLIPEIVEAGVNSFKIEGRMKRPEYAAGVTYAYRKYLDYYLEFGKEKFKEFANDKNPEYRKDMMMLKDLYNRGGFNSGYYENHNGKMMMSMDRPNHSGVCVGKVKSVQGISATIQLTEDVNAQDILEFRQAEQALYDFTVKNDAKKGTQLTTNFMRGSKIAVGNLVYRTKNNSLLDSLAESFMSQECKEKIQGYCTAIKGQPLMLTLIKGDHSIVSMGEIVEAAKNQPTTVDKIEKQLNKLNDTPFVFDHLEVTADEDVFLPVGKLNELRREAVRVLQEAITDAYRRGEPVALNETEFDYSELDRAGMGHITEGASLEAPELTVTIHEMRHLKTVLEFEECKNIYIDINCIEFNELESTAELIHGYGKKAFLMMPHIFRKETKDLFLRHQKEVVSPALDGYVIRSLEEFQFMKEMLVEEQCFDEKELILDYNVYIMNREAKEFWREHGIHHYTTPMELNSTELERLGCEGADMIVYGRIPVMVSAQCVIKNVGGYCEMGKRVIGDPKREYKDGTKRFELIDRVNKSFYVRNHCKFCYNTIYNGDCIALHDDAEEILAYHPRAVRLDFTFETESEVRKVMQTYIQSFIYPSAEKMDWKGNKKLTRGHFKRGIL